MLDATAQKLVSSHKVHREMRTSLEAVAKLVNPMMTSAELGEALHLHRISKGAELDWSQDHQRQQVLVGTGTRSGLTDHSATKLKDFPVVSVNLHCTLTNAMQARTYSLDAGLPCKSSRLVELNFSHNFVDLLRQKFLVQAKADATIEQLNQLFQRHVATAGFEYLGGVPILEGYRALGTATIVKAEPSISLADCLFFTLNLNIGIVGGLYAVHWADSYCIGEAGHLSLFGIA